VREGVLSVSIERQKKVITALLQKSIESLP